MCNCFLFSAPVYAEYPFASSASELKDVITVGWALNPCREPKDNRPSCSFLTSNNRIDFKVLEHLLIGAKSSPLYKALAESGLGEGVYNRGLETDLQHATFTVGLKGTCC